MAGLILLHLLLLCLQLSIKLLAHCLHVHENRHEETSTGVPLLKEHAHAVPGARVHASTARHCAVLTSSFSMFCLTAGNTVPTVRSVKTPPIILQSAGEMGSDRVWRKGKYRRKTTHVGGANITVSTLCVRDASAVLHPLRMPTPWSRSCRALASACERLRALASVRGRRYHRSKS